MPTNLEIAQAATLKPIEEIGATIGLTPEELEPYGRFKAKITTEAIDARRDAPRGKLVCVAGITPTSAGEGKTTSAVGLVQGLGKIGRKPVLCLREPSLGPVFGTKGGAAGGGRSQVVPMEDLNLHFTGDIHAITAANNLLAAMVDASIHHGNPHDLDVTRITWRRALDMNDRALRDVVTGLGGTVNGVPRESGFDITAASEVMAILAVASDLQDLRKRFAAITVGFSRDGKAVTAGDIGAAGAMTVLMKEAIKPNLVQTLEGQACLIHAGPFANIAHGNNSLIATKASLSLGDYVITESGFGSDMGMEKFFDIVCRVGDLTPDAVVLVATVRALMHHGGGDDLAALERGAGNLTRHIGIVGEFGPPCVVTVNRRPEDSDEQVELVKRLALEAGAFACEVNDGFRNGGEGATAFAEAVVRACDEDSHAAPIYPLQMPIAEKIETVARRVYGADGIELSSVARARIAELDAAGLDELPICMAKTPVSLSADPSLTGAPTGFTIPVRDIRAYTGAGWLVPLCGDVQQMPGLGKNAAALDVDVDADGTTLGLF